MQRVSGKVAIVTGAARGQGAAHARLLAAEGASVILTDIREAEGRALAAEIGAAARFVLHDVTDASAWDRVIAAAVEAFGGVDILVNNAGVVAFGTVGGTSADKIAQVLQVNLMGAVLGMQAAIPAMRARGGGSIVNISSIAGLRGAKGMFAYATSKWALRGATRSAAQDLAGDHIRVNLVLPGLIDTPMTHETASPDALQRARDAVPMARAGLSEEVAEAVLFLASDAAAFMTGSEMVVDGGASA